MNIAGPPAADHFEERIIRMMERSDTKNIH
jgi:hypothetical protein